MTTLGIVFPVNAFGLCQLDLLRTPLLLQVKKNLLLPIDTQTCCCELVRYAAAAWIDTHKSPSRSRQVELGRWRVSEVLQDQLTANTEPDYLNCEQASSLAAEQRPPCAV